MRRTFVCIALAAAFAVSACTPSAELVERSANDRLATALDLGPLQCEEVRAHPREADTWLLYCDRSTTATDWALVDTAVKYRDGHTRATSTSTAWFQAGSAVRSYKQTCEWAGSGFEWEATSCTAPTLVATFPMEG